MNVGESHPKAQMLGMLVPFIMQMTDRHHINVSKSSSQSDTSRHVFSDHLHIKGVGKPSNKRTRGATEPRNNKKVRLIRELIIFFLW